MLNFNSLLVFSADPEALADFYKKVFEKDPDWEGEGYFTYQVGDCYITFGRHDKVKGKSAHPERVMFNFETDDVKTEFERIKKLGAKVIAEPYQMGDIEDTLIATFADPDGNYFQLVSPWDVDTSIN